ncbi:10 kDa chaperonin 1, chloroplastic-like [Aristolochia californica]|uniref:10 kDa chaperonin 1, chloroplastic-like n=1 Tax=Aristolochia californica TaxID=171875 RepID=UPI0035DD9591
MASAGLVSLSKPSFLAVRLPSSVKLNFQCLPVSGRNALRINAVAKTWEPSKVIPQGDRVLVRLEKLPQQSTGGVLLPKSAVKFERYLVGEVLAFGAEAGGVEAGKKVLLSDISAYEVDLGTDAKHCFCKAGDLLALIE